MDRWGIIDNYQKTLIKYFGSLAYTISQAKTTSVQHGRRAKVGRWTNDMSIVVSSTGPVIRENFKVTLINKIKAFGGYLRIKVSLIYSINPTYKDLNPISLIKTLITKLSSFSL